MRLNVDHYRRILTEKRLLDEEVIKTTGLSKMTYDWILDNGFIECETLERIADAIGCKVGDILRPDFDGCTENAIEWIKDGERATLTLSQRRTISRVKRLAAKYPERCKILVENKDGSVYAHIPTSWIKISPPRELTESQIEVAKENLLKAQTVGRNRGQISTKSV